MAEAANNREAICDPGLLVQLPELAGWQPSVAEMEASIDTRSATMLSAIFDQSPMRDGDELPPSWHWAFFIEPALQCDIGEDGHPKKGGFLPPINLPRRMFAGSYIKFHRALLVGATYRRTSKIMSITMKEGRSGKLAFVKVEHVISDVAGTEYLIEQQDIVYREPDGVAKKSAPAPKEVKAWTWAQRVVADPVMLFRYSAVTFNGHRIHYDYPYVTKEEGYPGLVVHGPLLATLMLESLREKLPRERVSSFRFAGKAPVFSGQEFQAVGKADLANKAVELAILSGGQTAMTGQATLCSNL